MTHGAVKGPVEDGGGTGNIAAGGIVSTAGCAGDWDEEVPEVVSVFVSSLRSLRSEVNPFFLGFEGGKFAGAGLVTPEES
jgi:hypothetical protein